MAEAVQRVVLAHLIIKAHHPDRVAAVGDVVGAVEPSVVGGIEIQVARNLHRVFVRAEVGRAPNPNVADAFAPHALDEIQFLKNGRVTYAVLLVNQFAILPHRQKTLFIVAEEVALLRKSVHVDPLDQLVARKAAAGLADVTHQVRGHRARVVPLQVLAQAHAAVVGEHGIEVHHQKLEGADVGVALSGWRGRDACPEHERKGVCEDKPKQTGRVHSQSVQSCHACPQADFEGAIGLRGP